MKRSRRKSRFDAIWRSWTRSLTGSGTGRKHFTVTVPVSLSTTFFAWVFQYVGKMSILAPEYVREKHAGYLEDALDDALGE